MDDRHQVMRKAQSAYKLWQGELKMSV